jgi:hypothetical protein
MTRAAVCVRRLVSDPKCPTPELASFSTEELFHAYFSI